MARPRAKSDQMAGQPGVWQRFLDRISLPGMEAWSTTLRTLFLNGLFLIAVIVIVPILVGQFRRDQVIIEPIEVPETLTTQGLSSEVVASRIWDGLSDVTAAARTSKETIAAIPDARQVEFSFPDSGFSIESLVFHLRKLFNAYETRIAGEFVCGDANCDRTSLRLRLRVIRDRVDLVDLPPLGERAERAYFQDAASGVLAVLDPFVALAATAEKEPLKATILARRLIRQHHKDAKWAHNLIGNIRVNEADYPAAMAEFREALLIDPAFKPALANLGNSLLQSGDAAGARKQFETLAGIDRRNVLAAEGFADLALADGKIDEALKHLNDAAEWDPLSPRYLTLAGKICLDANRIDEGKRYLTRALEIDPGYLAAFAYLAGFHLAAGDNVAAEKIYRDAADYAPDDAQAQMSHGRILAILKRWDDAIVRYERAVALAPNVADYRLQLAQVQHRIGKFELALATVAEGLKLEPANDELYLVQANALRDLGRKAEAIEAYRKFLEFDKEDDPMRPIAERFIELLTAELDTAKQ